MIHRQSRIPAEWLIIGGRLKSDWEAAARRLPVGSGVLVLNEHVHRRERRKTLLKLRRICNSRRLKLLDEASSGSAARVHNARELRRPLSLRPSLVLLSPMFPTRSHPDWKPLPRMRAATLARLANRRIVALGGMSRRRFRAVQKLGFVGWAGIDAWIRT